MPMLVYLKSPSFGFTLLEVLVVISLLGILSVLGANVYREKNFDIYINPIVDKLVHMRAVAVNEGHVVNLKCNTIASNILLPTTISINCSDMLPYSDLDDAISFYPDGSSSGGIITVKMKGQKRFISIDWLTGKIQ